MFGIGKLSEEGRVFLSSAEPRAQAADVEVPETRRNILKPVARDQNKLIRGDVDSVSKTQRGVLLPDSDILYLLFIFIACCSLWILSLHRPSSLALGNHKSHRCHTQSFNLMSSPH